MLWRRVNRGLSAGRVQSPSIRLIVERERERIAFVAAGYWDIELTHGDGAPSFTATLVAVDGARVATGKDFDAGGRAGGVVVLDEARAVRWPTGWPRGLPGPLRRGEAVPLAAQAAVHDEHAAAGGRPQAAPVGVASDAPRAGAVRAGLHHVHAHRQRRAVDGGAQGRARAVAAEYGRQFLSPQPKQYTSKSKNAQEAHEAIRPDHAAALAPAGGQ